MALLLLAACGQVIPATVPAQLTHTPGPAVIITQDTVMSQHFRANYPPEWQVITSAAFSSPWVVFTAPEGGAVIVLALDAADTELRPPAAMPEDALRRDARALLDGTVTAAVITTEAAWEEAQAAFALVVDSVRTP
ncbi:MAG: hypothetical protein OHK0046_35960 [Anaerolineae bacterium]